LQCSTLNPKPSVRRWDEAIAIAESKNRPETDELKTSYFQVKHRLRPNDSDRMHILRLLPAGIFTEFFPGCFPGVSLRSGI